MSHSHASSPHQDVAGVFVHDAKDAALTTNGAAHCDPYTSCRHTPEPEGESDSEETTRHRGPDGHLATPNRTALPGDEPIVTGLDRTGSRVRFRSRVRISGGIGSWRRRRLSDGLSSNASSVSGSPSSSISAPLRTHYAGSNSGWGPLGSRLKLLASQASPTSPCQDDEASGTKSSVGGSGHGYAWRRCARSSSRMHDDADERTHLLSATRQSFTRRYVHGRCHDDDSEQEQERWWRERLMDEVFGSWPGRLFNRHWWWWHLEPIFCCLCESDEEE